MDKKSRIKMIRLFWCGRRDLNPYVGIHTPLKRARLPIPPLPRTVYIIHYFFSFVNRFFEKSLKKVFLPIFCSKLQLLSKFFAFVFLFFSFCSIYLTCNLKFPSRFPTSLLKRGCFKFFGLKQPRCFSFCLFVLYLILEIKRM